MKRVLVPLAAGFEEIEAVTVVDVLRRAGVEVTVAGLVDGPCRGSRGVTIVPDARLDDVLDAPFDLIVLPGGLPGSIALREDPRVIGLLRRARERGVWMAAICAAPTVLAEAGVIADRRVTSHPSVRDSLAERAAAVSDDRVVVDDRVITSQGPGTSMEFAFRLVATLCGEEKVAELNAGILALTE